MTQPLPVAVCLFDRGCRQVHHGYKHFFKIRTTRKYTKRGPAMYFKHIIPEDEEAQTIRSAGWRTRDGSFAEYLRDARVALGWDEGEVATLSYAECSGGELAGRAAHGRPMHTGNQIAIRMQAPVTANVTTSPPTESEVKDADG